MKTELVEQLYAKFPKIFPKKLYIGIGDGWYGLIESACYQIQGEIDGRQETIKWTEEYNSKLVDLDDARTVPDEVEQLVAVQIKEKFGTLRFYASGINDFARGVIYLAESMSGRMCEECGKPAKNAVVKGWCRTRCDEHQGL